MVNDIFVVKHYFLSVLQATQSINNVEIEERAVAARNGEREMIDNLSNEIASIRV